MQPQTRVSMGVHPSVYRISSGSDQSSTRNVWIDDLRNALGRYMWNHPDSKLDTYLETLTLVREAVGRGDRLMVKLEMDTYFRMLAMRSMGISEPAAKELSTLALQITPIQVYGIAVPRSLQR